MAVKQVVPGLHQISNNGINAFLIDDGDAGLTLIDAGLAKHAEKLEDAIRSIGRDPGELTHILLTHAHPDHLGSAAHLSRGTVPIALHPDDMPVARSGHIEPTMSPPPGLLHSVAFRLIMPRKAADFPVVDASITLRDGETLGIAGGIEVVHAPGHTAGHVVFLWKRDRGVLIAGDAAANLFGLGYMLGYDDVPTGIASLAKVARKDFEVAVFGHGRPITSNASTRFAAKFG